MYINKTTAVWLLQEGERASSDRLFRVRSSQPFNTSCEQQKHQQVGIAPACPVVRQTIEVGNIHVQQPVCAFMVSYGSTRQWRLGRVLQFFFILKRQPNLGSIQEVQQIFLVIRLTRYMYM